MTLEKCLNHERAYFITSEYTFRQLLGTLGKRFKGLPDIPSDAEIQSHLEACKMYYEMYNSFQGPYSPWITKEELIIDQTEET